MGQQTYSEQQPLDGDSKGFAGVLADNAGTNEFTATAGVNQRTQNGKKVADTSVQVTTAGGAGATIGATGDAAVSTGTGTISGKLRGMLDWLAALGATTDAAVEGDTPGTLSAKQRGLLKIFGAFADTKIITDTAGSISGKLRGLVYFAERLDAVLGTTADVALAPDNSGSLSAKVRSLTKILGATDDVGVSTDTNGTVSAKLRGLVILVVNLLSRWPATLGQKAMTASLPVVLPNDQSAIPVSQSGAWSIGGTVSLPTGAATAALQTAEATLIGAVNETAPASDTASSGLNGRLQRLAQRITTLIGVVQPASSGTYANAVAVGSSATPIVTASSTIKRTTIKNSEAAPDSEGGPDHVIWLGFDAAVTPGKAGHNIGPLYPGESWSEPYNGDVYGITASGVAYAAPARMS